MGDGKQVLGRSGVMDGVLDILSEIQIKATFPFGTKLVTVHQPIASSHAQSGRVIPGKYLIDEGEHELNPGRDKTSLTVAVVFGWLAAYRDAPHASSLLARPGSTPVTSRT